MRVLVLSALFPPDTGGPASYVPRMAAALADSGHDVTVVALADDPDAPVAPQPFRVVRVLRGASYLQRLRRMLPLLVRESRRADVVFVNQLGLEWAVARTLVPFLRRVPVVTKVVGDLAWERAHLRGERTSFAAFQARPGSKRARVEARLQAWWMRHAGTVVTPSRYLARAVEGWGVPAERIRVVYNAARLPAEPLVAAPRPLPLDVLVVMVCRLLPLKRVGWAVSVLGRLPGVGLVVVGDGPEMASLRRLAQTTGMADRVHFAGALEHAEALRLMAACDILASLSTHEGLPHVVLEARALGLVVVATDAGGTLEALGSSTRHVVVGGDTDDDLASALAVAAARATTQVAERDPHFDFATMVRDTEALLRAAAASRRTP